MKNEQKPIVITVSFIVAWLVGSLTLLCGAASLFFNPLVGILFLLIAAIVLPPANQFYLEKFNFKISGPLKIILTLLILGFISSTPAFHHPFIASFCDKNTEYIVVLNHKKI